MYFGVGQDDAKGALIGGRENWVVREESVENTGGGEVWSALTKKVGMEF